MIKIPINAKPVVSKLWEHGHEAYIVGGCVRDMLMGREVHDCDIACSALPDEVRRAFPELCVISTGLKHGTVTVISNGEPIEITTFRIDGDYSDSRRPDSVCFTRRLEDDLARRDFTCNALAYSDQRGLVDLFGGLDDIEKRIIRAVGEPKKRFNEDALRIIRAVRFSSVLGFEIEPETEKAMRECASLLNKIAGERLYVELKRLLCAEGAGRVIKRYCDVLDRVVPGLERLNGFEQHNKYHSFDVLGHTARTVDNIPPEPVLRLAALLHDIGKPDCFTIDERGVGHFFGHAARSMEIAENDFKRLKPDCATRTAVLELIKRHDQRLQPDERLIIRRLNRFGEQRVRQMIALQRADISAQSAQYLYRLEELDKTLEILDKIIIKQYCFTLKGLDINGNDLINAGYVKGKCIGLTLNKLLELVIDGEIENKKERLIEKAREMLNEVE